ncbi:hypothetical protein NQ315_014972 [Exocentrus adspersus]|uniref:Uncharacterized protein n=1 Tax=Exocentrus adspersus TaxID=1586481 RepID=A0AAV8V5T4_9CUCU|nr:hypothetical protein NQ315_014972 [Exocentrus adspersus]
MKIHKTDTYITGTTNSDSTEDLSVNIDQSSDTEAIDIALNSLTENISSPFDTYTDLNGGTAVTTNNEIYLFRKKLNEKLVSFICKLYAETTFSRKHVQLIIDDYILKTINSDHEIKEKDINHFFFEFENIFSSLDTEYLRFKYLEKSNYFVKPIEYIVGQKPDKISNNKTLPKNYTSQFIHIRDVLKKFFELPNVLSETSDLKEFGEDVIFSKAIDECNYLETTGIKVNQNGKEITIYFCLALLLGDNLGLNTILGFAESFRANFIVDFVNVLKI